MPKLTQHVILLVVLVMTGLVLSENYGQTYQVSLQTPSFQYSAFSTSTTTITFSLPSNTSGGSFSVTTFTPSEVNAMSGYAHPTVLFPIVLYGVYRVNILSWDQNAVANYSSTDGTSINLFSTNMQGLFNVDPSSMKIYVLNNDSNAWLDVGSYVIGATTCANSVFMVEDLIRRSANKTTNIGFTFAVYGGIETSFTPAQFSATVYLSGPGSVAYTLSTSLMQQLTLAFTNQGVSSAPVSFYLTKDNYIVNNYGLKPGYVTLYSFYYGIENRQPTIIGQTWTFSFDSEYGFKDGNGRTVQIDPSSITCAYRSSLVTSYYTQSATVSSNQVSCSGMGGNYPYVAIIAKSLVNPNPSPSIPSDITTLYSLDTINNYVYPGSKVYYKIDVPSGQYLTLYYSSSSSFTPYLYIGSGYVPTSSHYDYYGYFDGTSSYKAIYNSGYYSQTYYILIQGHYSYGSYYTLLPYVGNSPHYHYNSEWNYIVASAVAGSLGLGFCIFSMVVVFVVILKNMRRRTTYSRF